MTADDNEQRTPDTNGQQIRPVHIELPENFGKGRKSPEPPAAASSKSDEVPRRPAASPPRESRKPAAPPRREPESFPLDERRPPRRAAASPPPQRPPRRAAAAHDPENVPLRVIVPPRRRLPLSLRILRGFAIGLLALAIGLFGFWRWLLSGARTSIRETRPTPPVGSLPTVTATPTLPPNQTTITPDATEDAWLSLEPDSSIETMPVVETSWETLPPVETTEIPMTVPDYDVNLTQILLLGVDTRDAEYEVQTRSDTMILLTVNQAEDTIKLTSFQRDMLVYMPGSDEPMKLNEVHLYGSEMLMEVINRTFHLDIQHYIRVNIGEAEGLIDALGGLEIEVQDDPRVIQYLNECITEQNAIYEGWEDRSNWVSGFEHGGLLQMNGRQAIAFARMRYLDSDYARMERQRHVIDLAYQKLKRANVLQLISVAKAGFDMIATNLSDVDLTLMLTGLVPKMTDQIQSLQVPITGSFWEDHRRPWTVRANFNFIIPFLHEFVYGQRLYYYVPVRLVPYTPLAYYGGEVMPSGVLNGSYTAIPYTGAWGWQGDGTGQDMSQAIAGFSAARDAAAAPNP
ncbi:MAG: LCP family protein [Bacillota bacterium]|nr:LCP family protein [Bacillota bacterium]